MQLTNPNHCSFLWEQFHTTFLKNCEKLSISHPWLDDEELEAKAEEITLHFFYFMEREQLNTYYNTHAWRIDLR